MNIAFVNCVTMDDVDTYVGVLQQMEVFRVSSSFNQLYSDFFSSKDHPTPQICHEMK